LRYLAAFIHDLNLCLSTDTPQDCFCLNFHHLFCLSRNCAKLFLMNYWARLLLFLSVQIQMNCFIIVLKEHWKCATLNDSAMKNGKSFFLRNIFCEIKFHFYRVTAKNCFCWSNAQCEIKIGISTLIKLHMNGGKWNEIIFTLLITITIIENIVNVARISLRSRFNQNIRF
jgi:hypothetical protein